MILIDMNQVMISNFMAQIGNHTNTKVEENMFRHMVLNSLRSYNVKYSSEYGKMVIACDSGNCWRKQVFPFYKANRKKKNESSEIDWKQIYSYMNKIVNELRDNFPYKVVAVEAAEADDIIASVVKKHKEDNEQSKILILSGDKDFIQLHLYDKVEQYDPVRKKWIKHPDPSVFLTEHILKGDSGDGIPNVLSPDNCFVIGERQKTMTKQRYVNLIKTKIDDYDVVTKKNFIRNQELIDLNYIPNEIYNKVIEELYKDYNKDRSKLLNYMIKNKLTNLTEYISEF